MNPEFDEKKEQVKELTDIVAEIGQYVTLKKDGRNFTGLCPFHTEKTPSFSVSPTKRIFKCFGCGEGGNVIDFLMKINGQNFMDVFRPLAARCGIDLPAYSEDEVIGTPRRPRKEKDEYTPTDTRTPDEKWQARAEKFTAEAHATLLDNKEQLAWLADRGITFDTVKHFRLGWNPDKLYRSRMAWGLPEEFWEESGKSKKLLIPAGLVVPCATGDAIHRVIIRQKDPKNPKQKYLNVTGCGNSPLIIPCRSGGSRPWVIVETYLDAMLIWQEAGDMVNVMALGSAAAKADVEAFALLKDAPVILNALDFDNAGAKAWAWWEETFPYIAERWPIPEGKDPGEYVQEFDGDIREWIMAGLPEGLQMEEQPEPVKEVSDPPPSSMTMAAAGQEAKPGYFIQTTADGRDIAVTEDPAIYERLEAEGHLVFSRGEMKRITLAKEDAEAEGVPDPANFILDLKDHFRGSYVKLRREL